MQEWGEWGYITVNGRRTILTQNVKIEAIFKLDFT